MQNYQSKFRSLLYCEEVAMAIEHQMYSLQNVTLEHLGKRNVAIASCCHPIMTIPFRWKCLHDPGSWVEKWVTPLSFRHVLSLFNHSRLAHLFFWIEAQRENSKQRWPDYSRIIWGTWKKLSWRISCICSFHPKGKFSRSCCSIVQVIVVRSWC